MKTFARLALVVSVVGMLACRADTTGPQSTPVWLLGPAPAPGMVTAPVDSIRFGIDWQVLENRHFPDRRDEPPVIGVRASVDGEDVTSEMVVEGTRDYPPSGYTATIPVTLQPGRHEVEVFVLLGGAAVDSATWTYTVR